ncbi:cytochrome P450 [Aspergillus pseudoustus]|uniref:Cytochrome P450 n=1 Tax=Aspergillus pseudoustus TaxID=1810923 RepID=A0ABR4KCD6_9EURO
MATDQTPATTILEGTNVPSHHESDPGIKELESEAPPPSFTQTIRIGGFCLLNQVKGLVTGHDTSTSSQDSELWMAENYGHVPPLSSDAYLMMTSVYTRLNCNSDCFVAFTNRPLPSLPNLQVYIQVYFEEFHPVFPLLHKPTFSPTKDKWVLGLGVAAIGSLFSHTLRSEETFYILLEFLRRVIYTQLERTRSGPPDICIAQAAVLNQVGMMFSGDMRFAEIAQTTMAQVVTMCRKMACYHDGPGMPVDRDSSTIQSWEEWIEKESVRRFFYFSWMLDCQYNMFWDLPIMLPIESLQVPMPSHEGAWDATTADDWRRSLTNDHDIHSPATLRKVLLDLYRDRIPLQLGALSTLLLAMSIYRDAPRLRYARLYMGLLWQYAETLPPTSSARAALGHIHIVSVFIRIPPSELFAFSGWRVTEAQQVKAAMKLQRWMQSQRGDARAALMHACCAWSAIRTGRTAAQHECEGLLLCSMTIGALIELQSRPANALNEMPTLRLDRNSSEKLSQLHRQYGSIMRIGPHEVSLGDHRYYRPIYTDSRSTLKDPHFYAAATFVGKDNIFQMTNPVQHAARRRLSAAPYFLQSVASLDPLIRKKAKDLATRMALGAKQSPNRTVDAFQLCGRFSLEVICQAAFAVDLGSEENGQDSINSLLLMNAMDDSAKTLPLTSVFPWLRSTKFGLILPGPVGRLFRQHAERIVTEKFHLKHNNNITLPSDTVVGMQNYVHHRDASVFRLPELFQPERWLESTKEMDLCLAPFSLGRRNCIGQNIAWEELYLAIDAVMRGGFTMMVSKEMRSGDMDMEDHFNVAPKGHRLLLEIKQDS